MFSEMAEIIKEKDKYLAEIINNFEEMLFIDSYTVILKGRTMAERIARNIIAAENIKENEEISQKDRIYLLERERLLEEEVTKAFHTIRYLGNRVIHDEVEGEFETSLTIYRNIYKVLAWYVPLYISNSFEVKEYLEPKVIEKIKNVEKEANGVKNIIMENFLLNLYMDYDKEKYYFHSRKNKKMYN